MKTGKTRVGAAVFGLAALVALITLFGFTHGSVAQDIDVQDSPYTATFESPFVSVAESLKPSVVFISAVREREVQPRLPFFFENHPFFEDMQPEGEPRIQKIPSSGTGIIVDKDGYILTNNHVVQDASEITVKLFDDEEQDAEIIGTDPETDLALIKIDGKHIKNNYVAPLGDSDAIEIGEWAIAMGNPLGLDWTLTVGVISAKGRSNLFIQGGGPVFQDFIQTDASINFGNSGGPLANIRGEVIGINAAVNARANGIGFAIPVNIAKDVMRQLRDTGQISRGYLGMVPRELTDLLREALDVPENVEGIFVEAVEQGTPAAEGGLRESDVIVALDGRAVSDVNDFRFRVARHAPGEKLEATVLRDGKERDITFTLGNRSDYLDLAQTPSVQEENGWMGLEVASLDNPRIRRQTETEVESGVIVVGVKQGSPAEGVLRPGDIIVEIDQRDIEDMDDWRELTAELRDVDKAVLIKYHPQGASMTRYTALKVEEE